MFLSRVQVSHFRNLKDLTVDFGPGLNVLVGENNVGKTNLIEAIRIALGSAANTTADPIRVTKDDLYRDSLGNTSEKPIRVDLRFSDLNEAEQAEFLDILSYDANEPAKSTASIHFEWTWSERDQRWHQRRWGGERPQADATVPDEVLQAIPTTLLVALRDASSALAPGRQSRIGRLLSVSAADNERVAVEGILSEANRKLEGDPLIQRAQKKIAESFISAAGENLAQDTAILAADPKFDRIAQGLRLVLKTLTKNAEGVELPVYRELSSNGLGYNNLIYISTVLAELESTSQATLPLLFVEEPEAHLHPQLQELLAHCLGEATGPGGSKKKVQTLVTTHSPNLVAQVPMESIRVIYTESPGVRRCGRLVSQEMDKRDLRQLARMLDVTKASMLFSKGIVLVEGISEALLLPILAERMGKALRKKAISVVPICGVDFATIAALFRDDGLRIPVAILTDADPKTEYEDGFTDQWHHALPKSVAPGQFELSDRTSKLLRDLSAHGLVKVFPSKVTLEYDLAEAGALNAYIMSDAWQDCFKRQSPHFTKERVQECGVDLHKKGLLAWRTICLSSSSRGKGDFAHSLAEKLDEKTPQQAYAVPADSFAVPQYIADALNYVWERAGAR